MSAITIRTNNVPRPLLFGSDLTDKERAGLDYLDFSEENDNSAAFKEFFRYKGDVYDLGECMSTDGLGELRKAGWEGYYGETFFSSVVIKFVNRGESVIVGYAFQ